MVCSLSPIALFQPALPTASRALMNPISLVSSRRKWVWPSMINCFDSAPARSAAISGVAASAMLTSKRRPNTWFIATNEAAMPAAVWKKRRRDRPCRRASRSLSSLSRASTSRCFSVCGTGMYSSLDTICVGTGAGKEDVSAGCNSRSCSSVRNFMRAPPWRRMAPLSRHPGEGRGPFRLWVPAFAGKTRGGALSITLAHDCRDFEIEQARRIAAKDRAALDIVEPRRAFDNADRVYLAHIGRIIGAHQDVVGAVLLDQVFELVVRVDERVEIDPLQVGGRHPVDALAAIRAGRGGMVDAPGIGRQKPAAMRDD